MVLEHHCKPPSIIPLSLHLPLRDHLPNIMRQLSQPIHLSSPPSRASQTILIHSTFRRQESSGEGELRDGEEGNGLEDVSGCWERDGGGEGWEVKMGSGGEGVGEDGDGSLRRSSGDLD